MGAQADATTSHQGLLGALLHFARTNCVRQQQRRLCTTMCATVGTVSKLEAERFCSALWCFARGSRFMMPV